MFPIIYVKSFPYIPLLLVFKIIIKLIIFNDILILIIIIKLISIQRDFPGGAVVKNPTANSGDTGSSPGPGRSHMPWSS